MIPNQTGHTEANMSHDLGEYSNVEKQSYKDSWILTSSNFRYFGKNAQAVSDACPGSPEDALRMRQGHRVYKETDPVWHKLKHLVNDLLQRETLHTQAVIPRKRAHSNSETHFSTKENTCVRVRARN